MENLYESPHEHTYQGWGKKFEDFCRKLSKKGKEITFWRFLVFFKRENFLMSSLYFISCTADFMLPLLMEAFLGWAEDGDAKTSTGVILLLAVFILSLIRLIMVLQNNYYCQLIGVWCKNTIEVRQLLLRPIN